ncbi:hypothetical protein RI129_011216 [Pyrocoelia pectoralis]|uniref:Uncharacterized protein n=1 Tax=Pyrocoelia pectoralis TaxID=417401 RepID=A0AAN7V0M1_9COLE
MGKLCDKALEKRRRQKREAEQRRRDAIKSNAEIYEEDKKKERERYHRRRHEKKIKTINEVSERQKRNIRKRWKKASSSYRMKQKTNENLQKFLDETTPPSSPANNEHGPGDFVNCSGSSRQSIAGRKRVLRARSATVRRLKQLEKEMEKYKKKATRYKVKYHRLKKHADKKSKKDNTPRTKVNILTRDQNLSKEVKRQLIFGEVIKSQLSENFQNIAKNSIKEKQKFIKYTSGKIIKNYRFVQELNKCFGSYKLQRTQTSRKTLSHTKLKRTQLQNDLLKFFERDDNSRMCPGKKDTITVNKCKKQKRYVITESLWHLYKKFISEYTEKYQISYATFYKNRPFWVLTLTYTGQWVLIPTAAKRETCLCAVHENMLLLVTKMKLLQIINESNPEKLLRTICCDLREECLERTCDNCKEKTIPYNDFQNDDHATYKKWILKTIAINIKGVEKIPMTDILIHVDFSENYSCKYFREIQSAHFGGSKPQISLHTVVWYYRSEDGGIIPETFCSVSDNLRPVAILAHLAPLIDIIKEKNSQLQKVHFCSDGPSTQYRAQEMSWNYFESGHGKGAVDGVGGCLKRTVDRLVACGNDIADFDALVTRLTDNYPGICIKPI